MTGGVPHEVVLLFDFGGVISNSPFPAIRRYTTRMMEQVLDLALAEGSGSVVAASHQKDLTKPEHYANLFFDVIKFIESQVKGKKKQHFSSFAKLEMGRCSRLEFVEEYHKELHAFLEVLAWTPEMIKEAPAKYNKQLVEKFRMKYSLLGTPTVAQILKNKFDAENFLCLIEKCALRKNVLNMIHFLRAASHQEVKIGIITNNWEVEGGYLQRQNSVDAAGEAAFLPVLCPNDWDDERRNSFAVNSLFDSVSQSYLLRCRKPTKEIFIDGIRGCGGPSRRRHFFYFDDIMHNVEAAAGLSVPLNMMVEDDTISVTAAGVNNSSSGPTAVSTAQEVVQAFEKCYHITGGESVYKAVMDAINCVGKMDPRWGKIGESMSERIGPLFQPLQTRDGRPVPWMQAEEVNMDGNSVFLPIPQNPAAFQGDHPNKLSTLEANRLLFYLCRHLPEYFPITPPMAGKLEHVNLMEDPSLATSAGPIVIDYFKGGMSNPTYRITLRTGSFVVRKQPKGQLLKGAHDVRREYHVMKHLQETSKVPVPRCLLFCGDVSVIGTQFYVMRYMEGRIVRTLTELVRPPFVRPFSRSRVLNTRQISAKPYVRAAIKTLADLHNAPLPPAFAKVKARQPKSNKHPLQHLVNIWDRQYKGGIKRLEERGGSAYLEQVTLSHFEFLTEMLNGILQGNADIPAPPFPAKECLTHGDYKLDNMMFDYASCEEKPFSQTTGAGSGSGQTTTGVLVLKPKIVALMDFELCNLGDPLTDVAYLSLFNILPAPRGVANVPAAQGLFPSCEEILQMYCERTGALKGEDDERKLQILHIYQAAMCHKLCGIIHGVLVRSLVGNASDAAGGKKLTGLMHYLAAKGIELLGGEGGSGPQVQAKL